MNKTIIFLNEKYGIVSPKNKETPQEFSQSDVYSLFTAKLN